MKSLRDNWNKPNDVHVISNELNKQDGKRVTKWQSVQNELVQKDDHPKDRPDKY